MYNVKRSQRKTIGLYALKDGGFEVRAPYFVTNEEIADFVRRNESITKQWQLKAENRRLTVLDYGSEIPFRGKRFALESREGEKYGFESGVFYAPPGLKHEELVRLFSDMLKKLAKQYIINLAEKKAREMNSKPQHFSITSAKSRWGSCSTGGRICFSWRLICADDECIEYVIIHELCHLIHPNHSEAFWREVEKYIPDYKLRRKALRKTQNSLDALGMF